MSSLSAEDDADQRGYQGKETKEQHDITHPASPEGLPCHQRGQDEIDERACDPPR